jgi:hypothetical protein
VSRFAANRARVATNHSRLSKNWRDESLIRSAMADARSALAAWRKHHGKPE